MALHAVMSPDLSLDQSSRATNALSRDRNQAPLPERSHNHNATQGQRVGGKEQSAEGDSSAYNIPDILMVIHFSSRRGLKAESTRSECLGHPY